MLVVRISLLRNNWTRSKEKTRCVVIFNPSPRTSIFRVLFGSRIIYVSCRFSSTSNPLINNSDCGQNFSLNIKYLNAFPFTNNILFNECLLQFNKETIDKRNSSSGRTLGRSCALFFFFIYITKLGAKKRKGNSFTSGNHALRARTFV